MRGQPDAAHVGHDHGALRVGFRPRDRVGVEQLDDRLLTGANVARTIKWAADDVRMETTFGVQSRYDDIKVGESAAAKIGSANVLVCRTGQDTAVCFSAVCTHEGCQVKPDGAKLECPCHQSTYDAKTGKVLSGPAPKPLPKIAVKVSNGEIVTA